MAEGSDHENLTFKIGPDDVGVRLDAFLASQIEGWSRARLQRLIEAEDVLVNGKLSKPSYKLRENDELEVELVSPVTTSFTPEAIPIEIVYEDDTLVVVNKPAGLVVHPAAGIHSGTLANALAYHFQQLPNATSVRPGIVHRLDRDTSGLLVVAKTEAALENLSDQFRARSCLQIVRGTGPRTRRIGFRPHRTTAGTRSVKPNAHGSRAWRTRRVVDLSRRAPLQSFHAVGRRTQNRPNAPDSCPSCVAQTSRRRR